MALLVQKYGGTSVANLERIQRVADRVADSRRSGNQLVAGDNLPEKLLRELQLELLLKLF